MAASSHTNEDERSRRLMEQYTEIAALAGGLAHEIKNPLSTIRLNLSLLAEDFAESHGLRERRALKKIQTVQRECERLNEILEDFLRFARVREFRLELCELNEVIREVVDFIAPQADQQGIEVVPNLSSDLPAIGLDRELFKQALLNLVINAQHVLGSDGQIVLQTREVASGVQLDVIDNGLGMDPETLSRVFQPFFSTRREGSGLGLPTAKKIIESHNGTITVESAVGKGTHFAIILPAADPKAAH